MTNQKVWTGTLIGPEGERVGRYVTFEDHHNEIERLQKELSDWQVVASERNIRIALIAEERDRLQRENTHLLSLGGAALTQLHAAFEAKANPQDGPQSNDYRGDALSGKGDVRNEPPAHQSIGDGMTNEQREEMNRALRR